MARSHSYRNKDAGYVLVRPLPSHDVSDLGRFRKNGGQTASEGIRRLSGDQKAFEKFQARQSDGRGYAGGEVFKIAGKTRQTRRIRRNKRMYGENKGQCRRERGRLAVAVQKRNAQSSHRDRAFRRRGDVHRRCNPRSAVGQGIRVRGYARYRCGRSACARGKDYSRQTAAA